MFNNIYIILITIKIFLCLIKTKDKKWTLSNNRLRRVWSTQWSEKLLKHITFLRWENRYPSTHKLNPGVGLLISSFLMRISIRVVFSMQVIASLTREYVTTDILNMKLSETPMINHNTIIIKMKGDCYQISRIYISSIILI